MGRERANPNPKTALMFFIVSYSVKQRPRSWEPQARIVGGGAALVGFRQQYDVAPDGRFLINVTPESAAPITLILNWRGK